jgi:hypothetical protein
MDVKLWRFDVHVFSAERPRAQARFAAPPAHQAAVVRRGRADSGWPGDVQPPLGFGAHELVVDLWAVLGSSVEGQFYSAGDWQLARLEMWFADRVMRSDQVPSSNQWTAVQRGLDELLVSPAVKRPQGLSCGARVLTRMWWLWVRWSASTSGV